MLSDFKADRAHTAITIATTTLIVTPNAYAMTV